MRTDKDTLLELSTHPGWEVFRQICLQGQGDRQAYRRELEVQQEKCLSANNLAGARYYNGQIKLLDMLCDGSLFKRFLSDMEVE